MSSAKEVVKVYTCFICNRSFSSVQALRGHMRVHKAERGVLVKTSFILPRSKLERFRELCRRHKTTECHLLEVLIDAALKADELGVIRIGSENPVIVYVVHNFYGKPRSPFKLEIPRDAIGCGYLQHKEWLPPYIGWCMKIKRWVELSTCITCKFKA
ncbi:MAG: C2H2-type zinc finger protein [Sulfolobales archaeon]